HETALVPKSSAPLLPPVNHSVQQVIVTDTLPAPKPCEPAPNQPAPNTLEGLVDLASQVNPILGAARARAEAARGTMIQAGLLPNPLIGWRGDDMNEPIGQAGKQGMIFQQTIPTGGKPRLDVAAAA